MKSTDIDQVYNLGLNTEELQIDPTRPAYYPKDTLEKVIKSNSGVCLVARVDGNFAGFTIANYHDWYLEGYLSDTVVKKEYRNLGIGKKLFEEKMKRLRKKGARWFWALVHTDNKIMQRFIEKQGFKKGRDFYFYYKND